MIKTWMRYKVKMKWVWMDKEEEREEARRGKLTTFLKEESISKLKILLTQTETSLSKLALLCLPF